MTNTLPNRKHWLEVVKSAPDSDALVKSGVIHQANDWLTIDGREDTDAAKREIVTILYAMLCPRLSPIGAEFAESYRQQIFPLGINDVDGGIFRTRQVSSAINLAIQISDTTKPHDAAKARVALLGRYANNDTLVTLLSDAEREEALAQAKPQRQVSASQAVGKLAAVEKIVRH